MAKIEKNCKKKSEKKSHGKKWGTLKKRTEIEEKRAKKNEKGQKIK